MNEITRNHSSAVKQREGTDVQSEWAMRELIPAVDIHEEDDAIHVTADMPGVTRESLRIELNDQTLEIEGDIKLQMPEGVSATFAEVRASRYRRRFTIGQAVDREGIKAQIADGVLHLNLPKAKAHRRRRIDIQAA
ncbi:HSP20 family molecular chaperone IbpA [Natronocella acetinitrilica]|uniref:HSP20 family molecular chaperone IbpA n=1 Tax=Natronocella acetinitrilica TaxID=414046 RepID=A0AAE3G0P3_9GAMM|nr:Hsp20/alpha crystallin family protein [Natronocella acetinitrilica]MCP1673269.1 HSP20 family molecular chaperone IbpA [Natronocella acetinitrilica]